MKRGDIDQYINMYPQFRRWILVCPLCHAKGYDPKMPDDIGSPLNPGYAARYIRRNLPPLEVDEMGFCLVCSKHINKS
jgi:hypothetical protein